MSLLDEKEPAPSLALITAFVAIVTAIAFGGVWAINHVSSSASVTPQQQAPASVEGNI